MAAVEEMEAWNADETVQTEGLVEPGAAPKKKGEGAYALLQSNKLEQLKPFLEAIVGAAEKALPFLELGYSEGHKYWDLYLAPYWSNDLAELFLGLVLLFLGGNFALTIACYTAIKLSGYDTLKQSCIDLWESYQTARTAINKDLIAEFDEDGDGIVSAAEIAKAMKLPENRSKLTFTLLKTLDPQIMMEAFKGIWIVLLSVFATLRSQFAQQITIGANVGKVLQDCLEIWVEPSLQDVLRSYNAQLVRWSNFIIVCFSRLVCITVSMMLAKVFMAYHSALKGGDILSKAVMRILIEQEIMTVQSEADKEQVRIIVMNMLAFYGFYSQASSAFYLPWWLKFPLFPFVFLESILTGLSYYAY